MVGYTPGVMPAWTYYGSPVKLEKNVGMLAGVADCGRSRKWGCRGRLAQGFKPKCSSHAIGRSTGLWQEGRPTKPTKCGFGEVWSHMTLGLPLPLSFGSWKATCSSDTELSLSSLGEGRRDASGRKGVKGLLLVGHKKVPHGFGLRTGDPGDTADGSGNCGRPASQAQITEKDQGLPEPQTSISFPEMQYPGLGKGGKEGLCVFVGVLGY